MFHFRRPPISGRNRNRNRVVSLWIFPQRFLARSKHILVRFVSGVNAPLGPRHPGPIAPVNYDDSHEGHHTGHGYPGRNAKDAQCRGHTYEFGDQGQPIHNHEVDQRKPASECAKAIKNRLGVAALGHSSQAYRHLLHVVGDWNKNQQKPD